MWLRMRTAAEIAAAVRGAAAAVGVLLLEMGRRDGRIWMQLLLGCLMIRSRHLLLLLLLLCYTVVGGTAVVAGGGGGVGIAVVMGPP